MSETAGTLLAFAVLILVYAGTRKWHAWRMRNTFRWIIDDLRKRGAEDPDSAVSLRYAKVGFFRLGTRDYRPGALQYLVSSGLVGLTPEGSYYLTDKGRDLMGPKHESNGGLG